MGERPDGRYISGGEAGGRIHCGVLEFVAVCCCCDYFRFFRYHQTLIWNDDTILFFEFGASS